jgi:ABC-type Fe3+-siderophore transport system permease subunit
MRDAAGASLHSVVGRLRLPSHIGAVLAVIGHVVASLCYVLLPGIEVPFPALYGFWVAWIAVFVLALYWLRGHPWRTVTLVVIGVVAVNAVRMFGEQQFGWRG